jgi:hypothetical protein
MVILILYLPHGVSAAKVLVVSYGSWRGARTCWQILLLSCDILLNDTFSCSSFVRIFSVWSVSFQFFFSRPVIGETSTGMDVGAIVKRMTSFVHCFHFSIVRWVVSSMAIHQCKNWIKFQSQINVPAVVWLKCMPFGAQIPIMNLRWQRRMLSLLPIISCALTYIGSWYVSMHEHPVCSMIEVKRWCNAMVKAEALSAWNSKTVQASNVLLAVRS